MNVVFIICDDLNNALAGMGRIPFAPAPNLRRLMDGAGQICRTPVTLIDIYPTLIDLCGLPRHPNAGGNERALDGYSLRPLLQDPAAGQWDGPPVALSSVRQDTGIHHSVRSATHRYTLCQNGEEELYDHRSDPHEWHNLAGDGALADVKAGLRHELLKLVFGGKASAHE